MIAAASRCVSFAVLVLASIVIPGCGDEAVPPPGDAAVASSQPSGTPGPDGAGLVALIEKDGLLPRPWRLEALDVENAINTGDEVEPLIKGRMKCAVRLDDDLVKIVETVAPLSGAKQKRVVMIEVVARAGDRLDLFSTYRVQRFGAGWTFIDGIAWEPSSAERSRFMAGGVARASIEADEMIEVGTPRESEFRARRAEESERLRREAAERREAVMREREAAAASKEAERLASVREEAVKRRAAIRDALGRARKWHGTTVSGVHLHLELDGTSEVPDRVAATVTWRGSWESQNENAIATSALTGRFGPDSEPGLALSAEGGTPRLELATAGSGGKIAGVWSSGTSRDRIEFDPVVAADVQARTELFQSISSPHVWEGEIGRFTQEAPAQFRIHVEAIDSRNGAISGELHIGSPLNRDGRYTRRRFTGVMTGDELKLRDRDLIDSTARAWSPLTYELVLKDGKLTGYCEYGGRRDAVRLARIAGADYQAREEELDRRSKSKEILELYAPAFGPGKATPWPHSNQKDIGWSTNGGAARVLTLESLRECRVFEDADRFVLLMTAEQNDRGRWKTAPVGEERERRFKEFKELALRWVAAGKLGE